MTINKAKQQGEPHPELFMQIAQLAAKATGVDKLSSAMHYLTLCGDEINRSIFNTTHHASPQKKADLDRKKFIAIFRARYLEFTDLEYESVITGIDGKTIEQLNNLLEKRGFEIGEYLKWLFEVWAPKNEKMCPPTIKLACSSMCTEKFAYENRDLLKKKREEEIRRKRGLDLINRGRILIRESKSQEQAEIVKKIILDYRDGRIMSLDELSDKISAVEAERAKCQQVL